MLSVRVNVRVSTLELILMLDWICVNTPTGPLINITRNIFRTKLDISQPPTTSYLLGSPCGWIIFSHRNQWLTVWDEIVFSLGVRSKYFQSLTEKYKYFIIFYQMKLGRIFSFSQSRWLDSVSIRAYLSFGRELGYLAQSPDLHTHTFVTFIPADSY